MWKNMSDPQTERFHKMAEQDKKRHDTEMLSYTPAEGEKVRKRKQMEDPNAPKPPLNAYLLFCKDERPKVKAANPDYSFGDISKEVARRWAEIEPCNKVKFEGQAEQDKARYEKEMNEYRKRAKGPPVNSESKEEEEDEEGDD